MYRAAKSGGQLYPSIWPHTQSIRYVAAAAAAAARPSRAGPSQAEQSGVEQREREREKEGPTKCAFQSAK